MMDVTGRVNGSLTSNWWHHHLSFSSFTQPFSLLLLYTWFSLSFSILDSLSLDNSPSKYSRVMKERKVDRAVLLFLHIAMSTIAIWNPSPVRTFFSYFLFSYLFTIAIFMPHNNRDQSLFFSPSFPSLSLSQRSIIEEGNNKLIFDSGSYVPVVEKKWVNP